MTRWAPVRSSGDASNCVNLAIAPDGTVRLRDSKVPRVVVTSSPDVLQPFIGAVINGSFDRADPARPYPSS
ncbi:DUF397 domain-containing protein [Streptomyces sp. NPDC002911]